MRFVYFPHGKAWICLLLLAALPPLLCGQTQGEITGVVRDTTGGVIPGASVTVTNPATNFTRTAISNEAGVYAFPSLQPGSYNIKVELAGFRTITQTEVVLQVQQSARLDFTLEVGQVTETIEVLGTTALIASENATVGTVIDNKRIVDMPLNGRNFLQLVALSPNVSFGFNNAGQAGSRQGGTRAQQNIAVAGQRSMFNRFMLDGMENTDVNFNTYVILPSIDALQEFKVQTGVFPAEYGRATTQINVSTKSGTNQFHGAVFEFHRNDVLDAKQYAFTSARPKEPFKWNQYGFTLGGPFWIPKLYKGTDRLFFMSNFEGFRERRATNGIFSVPSTAMREGNFSAISQPIFDPLNRSQQFPGNVIPSSRIHPLSIKLLEFYPAPNLATGGSLSSNFQNSRNNLTDKDQFIQRIDFVESTRSSWFGRYSYADDIQLQPNLILNGTKLLTTAHQTMISNTRVLSPTMVNEFRAGYNRFFNSLGRELANIRDVVSELKIPGVSIAPPIAWGIPSISIAGFSGFGDDSEGPYVNTNHLYQFADNFSWTRGKHSLRLGVEIRRDQYNQVGNQFARGAFLFEPNATRSLTVSNSGHSFADFLVGHCKRCEASVALAVIQFRATSQYWYVDDTWKIHPKVTLNFGLRYEYTPTWFDENGTLVNAHVPFFDNTPNVADLNRHPTLVRIGSGDFYEGIPLRFNPAIKVARDGRLGEKLVRDDRNDFAPRLGIAWNPTLRWVVRTGFGVFYTQDTGNPRFDMARNLAGRRRDESSLDQIDLTWNAPFRNLGGTVQVNNPYVLANINNRRTPYSMQYLLNIQREIGRDTALEVGYLGSVSRKLESLRAWNESIPSATGSVLSRAPYPQFGRIQEVDGSGKGSYNALSVKLQRRFSAGLTYLFGYTWSRSIDTASAIRNHGGDTLFPQNSYNLAAERALSGFHTAHRSVTSVLYELPVGRARRYLNRGGVVDAFLGGWQLGSIVVLQSGFPITVTSGRDQSNIGAGFDRPNYVSGQVVNLDSRSTERWFNTAAFVLQPFGTFGNTGRNTFVGPSLISWDFSTHKDFRIREGHALQFRFEAFNFPNHPNWGDPTTSVTNVNFGKIRGTRLRMRELQFALKYLF